MDFVDKFWSFLSANWGIMTGVAIATFLVGALRIMLVSLAYRGIVADLQWHRGSLLNLCPVSMEKIKEAVERQHPELAWILSRHLILAECFEKLKEHGLSFWSDELKSYCYKPFSSVSV
jgi:hypothetical protein